MLAKKLLLQVYKVCYDIYLLTLSLGIYPINQLNLRYCIYIQLNVTPKEMDIVYVYVNFNRMVSLKYIFIKLFLANW